MVARHCFGILLKHMRMPQEKYAHKILIIEDEQAMRDALVDNLQAAGFGHVDTARDGEEGIEKALKEKPDLILLDIVLPKNDGMTVLSKLRSEQAGKDIKVILLTNLSANDDIIRGVVAGEPSYYIIKAEHPMSFVIEKVKNVLSIE